VGKLSDIPLERITPPAGVYRATCIGTKRGESKVKHSPYLELEWMAADGDGNSFTDSLYLTPKAINRLALVAKRVCGVPDSVEISDNKVEAVEQLAVMIEDNIVNHESMVTIEEYQETYMPQSGPDVGKMKTVAKRKVAFSGYAAVVVDPGAVPHDEAPF